MHEPVASQCTALSRVYFTKEFPGFEIESKWSLLTQNPIPVLLGMQSDIQKGAWRNYEIATAMGKLPVGVRFFNLCFQFWGNLQDGKLEQVAMVACLPEEDKNQLAFKSQQQSLLRTSCAFRNPPLVRSESRTGDWITHGEVIEKIYKMFPQAYIVGEIRRQKCFIYITNTHSYRNYSVSADLCHHTNRTLSQVEVEYKGRRGCWLPDTTGAEIARDFAEIHSILERLYGAILVPTSLTKFEWITSN